MANSRLMSPLFLPGIRSCVSKAFMWDIWDWIWEKGALEAERDCAIRQWEEHNRVWIKPISHLVMELLLIEDVHACTFCMDYENFTGLYLDPFNIMREVPPFVNIISIWTSPIVHVWHHHMHATARGHNNRTLHGHSYLLQRGLRHLLVGGQTFCYTNNIDHAVSTRGCIIMCHSSKYSLCIFTNTV
jgi:hypothetical protein